MKRKEKNWIPAALLTIAATIATVYCLLEYRDAVWILGIASLVLLASAFWLFTCVTGLHKREPELTVGEEQRERMNYEGMKLQGEELIRLVNSLGKGTYVQSKRSAEALQELLKAQQMNTEQIQVLVQEQTKAAKFQVKYAQDDATKIVGALSGQCASINSNLEKCLEELRSRQSGSTADVPDRGVSDSLNELSRELAHINTSIQALQLQLSAGQQTVAFMPVQAPQGAVPVTETAEEPQTSVPEPQPVSAQIQSEEQEETISEEETILTEQESIIEEPQTESVVEPEEPVGDVSSIISDDPNKKLSPDEIAALFAALG